MKTAKKYINRLIDNILLHWKQEADRKPLLLRGARQVGKSSAVKELSTHFQYFVTLNFEAQPALHRLFEGDLNPVDLCENIAVYFNTPIIPGKTLLFFDEIQSCIPAISSLRFFYEKMPALHLIAAGSLLEFALNELPSYGVGRVRSLFVYPFSFDEFLSAIGENALLEIKQKASPDQPLSDIVHQRLLLFWKKFIILGGMPEVVSKYVSGYDLLEIQSVLDDLIISVKADFAKYKKRVPSLRILEVFESVARQMGQKFTYSKAATDTNLKQIKEALDLLMMAGLVIPVTHSSANGVPIGAETTPGKRKLLLYDTGIFQRLTGLDLADIIAEDDFNSINKGAIAELFTGLELLKYSNPFLQESLYYWHRESPSANAEVDYIFQKKQHIIPIEVKSSARGSMQSMYQFMKEKKPPYGVRFSLENFALLPEIEIFPIYAVSNFVRK